MSNILEKIAELTEKRDVEISINIKLGQDVVKTTSDALAVMANELVNVMDILENKTKNHAKEAIFNATKENKDS